MLFFATSLSEIFVTLCLYQCNRIGKPSVASKQKRAHSKNVKFRGYFLSPILNIYFEELFVNDVFKVPGA